MYLFEVSDQTKLKEDTSVNLRIHFSHQTVNALQERLQAAYHRGDMPLVRRISALLGYVVGGEAIETLSARWGFSVATFYHWLKELLEQGVKSLVYSQGRGGRPAKLTRTQKKQLGAWIEGGPQAAGFESACWSSILIQVLIEREFQVRYDRFYICELLGNLDFSFQKARFVSDHLDEAKRAAWIQQDWPRILKQAQRRKAQIWFGDEASFPQWGSLSYTWARKGEQPQVKTSGKRKAYKVFGMIEYFSGRLFYQGIQGKFNSESYQAFLLKGLRETRKHWFLIHDGAKYHTSKVTQKFLAEHRDRITECRLPSYSPDYNPIEFLWRKVKKAATHNKYFEQFEQIIVSVDKAMAYFAQQTEAVLGLFGLYCREVGLAK
jgi:transposase